MNYEQFKDKYILDHTLDIKGDYQSVIIKLSWVQFSETIIIDPAEDIKKAIDNVANTLHNSIQQHYHPCFFQNLFKL